MEEVVKIINYCIWGVYFIGTIWITRVQLKRFIKAIKREYVDCVLASWWLLLTISWILMLFFFIISCLPYKYSDVVVATLASLHSIMFALFFWVWLLTTFYAWLLNIYLSKLNLLLKGIQFNQVKKMINNSELFMRKILVTISVVYIISYTAIAWAVYFEGCTREVYAQGFDKHFSHKCATLFWINFSKNCIDFCIALMLFVLQLIMYKKLINLLKSRLKSYFEEHKRPILTLYVWSSVGFFFRILYVGFYVAIRVDRLEAYVDSSSLPIELDIARKVLLFTNSVSLVFYVYYSTKYIDLVLFLYAWMVGHRVGDKFDKMSHLIIKSRFYNRRDSSLQETNSEEFLQLSNPLAYSFIEDEYSTQESSFGLNS